MYILNSFRKLPPSCGVKKAKFVPDIRFVNSRADSLCQVWYIRDAARHPKSLEVEIVVVYNSRVFCTWRFYMNDLFIYLFLNIHLFYIA